MYFERAFGGSSTAELPLDQIALHLEDACGLNGIQAGKQTPILYVKSE